MVANHGAAREAEVIGERILDPQLEGGHIRDLMWNTMLPLASTEATSANPNRSNTPRSLSLVMLGPLGAIPRSRAAYLRMR
jgi:hypothetical protein